MRLNKIEEKLHQETSEIADRSRDFDTLDPRNIHEREEEVKIKIEKAPEHVIKEAVVTKKERVLLWRLTLAIGVLLVSLGAAYLFYVIWSMRFSPNNVLLSFSMPPSAEEGQDFTFNFLYHNNNRVDLENCQLTISFPQSLEIKEADTASSAANKDFIVFDLGTLKSKQNGKIAFKARIIEKEQSIIYVKSALTYRTSDSGPQQTKETQEGITITSSKVNLLLSATRQAAPGDLIEYKLIINNATEDNFNGLEVHTTYPPGYQFNEASIPASENNTVFKLPTLISYGKAEFTIRGSITGSANEKKNFGAEIGYYEAGKFIVLRKDSAQTEMITSPLIITQSIKGGVDSKTNSTDPGSSVAIDLRYRNASNLPLRDAVVMVDIIGRAVDSQSIQAEKGHFDMKNSRVTWRAGEVPDLALLKPQAEGTLTLYFNVSPRVPSESLDDKNFSVTSVAQIDSPDVPTPIGKNKIISSDRITFKVNSKVIFDSKGYFNDDAIPNDGPLPPRVDKETTYTVHWRLQNINNDLKDAVVKASLPDYVVWKNNFYPSKSQQITYNERTKEVIWNLGFVPALTGTQLEAQEAIFQVSVTPQENQVGQELNLINESLFTAIDAFTGRQYELRGKPITTGMEDDAGIGPEDGTVVR